MLWSLENLVNSAGSVQTQIDGRFLPARPMTWPWNWRIRLAWMVLRGQADAVVWPGGQ